MRNVEERKNKNNKKGLESDGDCEHVAHVAAASGDVPMLVQAIQHDPSVIQQQDGEGLTPLAHAVHGQHLHAVKRLVKMGADVNATDSQGRTYLAIAAYQGWSDGVLYLLRNGARQNIVDKSGRTPLHASTYDTDCRSLVALLKRLSVEDVNAADNEKMTALHWAAFHDRPDHVRQLLAKGADPLAQDIDGKTALHWAAQNGSRHCCTMLAEGDVTSGMLLRLDNMNKSAMHLAAAAGRELIIADLAKHVPELLEMKDQDDRTPLHWSAAMGHANCVKVLLGTGVRADPLDVDGMTPLQYAKQAKRTQCVDILEESLGLKQNHKHRGKHERTTSGDSKKSSVGFFKGLFGKKEKEKQRPKETNRQDSSSNRLPKVSINGKTHMTSAVATSGGHFKDGGSGSRSKRGSGSTDVDNGLMNSAQVLGVSEELSAKDESEHRKKKKKHKRIKEKEDDRPSSHGTAKTSSTWNDDKARGDKYPSKLRTTHVLSPLGGARPPSVSPVLGNRQQPKQEPAVPLKRQGELSPLRRTRGETGSKLHSPVPGPIAKLKDVTARTPTPPPKFSQANLNSRKALPEISPLTQGLETTHLENKKPHKSSNSKTKLRHEYKGDQNDKSSFEMRAGGHNDMHVQELHGTLPEQIHDDDDDGGVNENYGAGFGFPRHPADDAVSLYKLRHKRTNHVNNEDSFCE